MRTANGPRVAKTFDQTPIGPDTNLSLVLEAAFIHILARSRYPNYVGPVCAKAENRMHFCALYWQRAASADECTELIDSNVILKAKRCSCRVQRLKCFLGEQKPGERMEPCPFPMATA
jgi:hypothetical protein